MRFTDDSIISVPIPIENGNNRRRKSFLGKIGEKIRGKEQNCRIIRMTRREYLARYAKDENGNYIGTEPQADEATREATGRQGTV